LENERIFCIWGFKKAAQSNEILMDSVKKLPSVSWLNCNEPYEKIQIGVITT